MLSFGAATFWMNDPPPVEPMRWRGVPMLLAAASFAVGVVLARQWHPPFALFLATALLLALAVAAMRKTPRVAWWPVLALWSAVGCWCAQVQPPAHRPTAMHPYVDGLSRTVRGRVTAVRSLHDAGQIQDAPQLGNNPWSIEPGGWETEGGQAAQSIDLELSAIEEVTPEVSTMRPVAGGLRVTLFGMPARLSCGAEIEVPVRLREPEVYRDPGAFSYADWLLRQGVGAVATAQGSRLQVLPRGEAGWPCRLGEAQAWASSRLQSLPSRLPFRHVPAALRLRPEDVAMLAAMLFGDRSALSQEQRAGFERTGTFHLFVVSGLHVTLITGTLFWLLRKARIPEFPALGLTVSLATGYALLTGFGIPVRRALVMTSLYLLARALDRQRSGLNALGVAVLLILVPDPRALFESSLQMTALVIFAVAGIGAPVAERLFGTWRLALERLPALELDGFLPPRIAARRVRLRMISSLLRELFGGWVAELPARCMRVGVALAEAAIFSLAIELCMALPIAVYFHRMVPLALPANLLVAPLAGALLGGAVLSFGCGLLSFWLAAVPSALTALLLHTIQWVVRALGEARLGDLRTPAPPSPAWALCALLLGTSICALRCRRQSLTWGGIAAALLMPVVVLWPGRPLVHPDRLEVTAIDVGQGDSLLVVSPLGRTMLVDAGGPVGRVKTKWDVGEEVVAPFLWSRQLRRLDAVVVTHGHSDHIGGMPAILRDLRPRELWLSLQPGQSSAMRDLLAQADRLDVKVHWLAAGDAFDWGGMRATVLAPERGYANYGEAKNDDSLVVRLDWQKASVLLEGDAESPSEAAMVEHGRLQHVTLLKVGHHGSRTSTTPTFLQEVAPRAAVISVGAMNTFGHPRWEVLDRLEASHVKTYRTDRQGAETFLLSADGTLEAASAYR